MPGKDKTMLTCYLLNRVPNDKEQNYPIWTFVQEATKLKLSYSFGLLGRRAVVRFIELQRITLGERGTYCIFICYAHILRLLGSMCFEPDESVSIDTF